MHLTIKEIGWKIGLKKSQHNIFLLFYSFLSLILVLFLLFFLLWAWVPLLLLYFRCYPAMSAKIFDMKDSASESLGAFAEPLLAKQVPSYPLLLSYPRLDRQVLS